MVSSSSPLAAGDFDGAAEKQCGSGCLVLLVPAALVLHFGVVKREERYLEAKFTEAYRVYKGNVPRYGWRRLW